jgi:hypothetical protein
MRKPRRNHSAAFKSRVALETARLTGIFEDVSRPGRFLETFVFDSWLEDLRQYNRVTNADRVIEDEVHRLLEKAPETIHFIAAQRRAT